jgi:hypothetical protein
VDNNLLYLHSNCSHINKKPPAKQVVFEGAPQRGDREEKKPPHEFIKAKPPLTNTKCGGFFISKGNTWQKRSA